uniref:Nuclear pore complex protein Nup153 n=1 Tax=Schistocephalus solidus TaxID=70667 RepID=A0A0X3QAE0_SCHSO
MLCLNKRSLDYAPYTVATLTMGDPTCSTDGYQCGGVRPRRKSLLHRITDSLSSFFPSSFFESNRGVTTSASPQKRSRLDLPEQREQASQSKPCSHPQEDGEQSPISYFYSKPPVSNDIRKSSPSITNVDLDAKDDSSDNSVDSQDSVSTSGVSSLLPHYSRYQPLCSTGSRFRTQNRPPQNKFPSVMSRDVSTWSKEVSMTRLWTDSDQQKRPAANTEQPSSKRMRTESTQTCPTIYPRSPFYGGRTSYGGLKQHRCRGMFEHVAPLKFIVETAEERSPLPISQGASSAMLSATARRILENLERHSSPITSNDKIPLPNPRPPPPIMPLRARTTRYPSYMAAYHRFKANQRQQTLVSGACNDSTAQKSLFRYAESGDQPSGCGKVPAEKDPVVNSKDATRCPQVSLHSPTVPLCLSKDATSSSIVTEPKCVPLMVSSAPSPPAVAVSRPVNSDGLRRISSSPAFKFSSPISLKIQPSDRPSSTVSQDLHYTFSYPKSSLKIPAVSSSSFLPVLFSADGPTTSSVPIKRACNAIGLSLWRCESCLTENSDSTCASCHLPKPASKGLGSSNSTESKYSESNPSTIKTKLVNNGSTLLTTKSSWNCSTCLVSNKGESDACVCCQTKRSLTSSTTTANTATFNFGKPPPSLSSIDEASKKSANGVTLFVNNSNWECPTCLVSNKDSLNECPCCQTKKPAVSSGKKSPALAAPSFRFGEFPSSRSEKTPVASASGSSNANGHFSTSVASTWDCPTCLVSNKSTVDQCPCCQTRRPYLHGVASVNPQTTPVMFSFGSPSTSNDHPTSSSPPVIISNVKAAPFKFGVPAVSNSAASAAPNFSFSASIASTVSSVSSSVTSPSPIFNFSASTPVLNKFGTQSKSENPSDFTLGFKSANFTVVKPSTSLAYGLSPKPLDSTVNASAPNGTLPTLPASNSLFTQIKFGSTSSASASTPNGIPSTSTSANPVAPAFIFGATQMKENVTPPIGLNSQPGSLFAKPPSAASTTANSQPTAPFKFGNPNQTAPFLFNSSSNGNDGVALFSTHPSNGLQPTSRPIRRAVRRFHRN